MKHAALTRSRGAIAIMFALTIFVLFGFMALAIDLGRTYVVRTELQNAADAAALAGAKALNQKLSGITDATSSAIAIAGQNNFLFSEPVGITAANLEVGSCPANNCMVPITSVTTEALAAGKTFLRVQIPSGNIPTFFARLIPTANGAGIANTNTFGSAVAGQFLNEVTPIGVCGRNNEPGRPIANNELSEFGFRRGASYNIFRMGNLGAASDPYMINPVDVYPNTCDGSHSSANATAPFVCTGLSASLVTIPGTVYGNTGVSAQKMQAALNSRFNDYSGPSVCDPVQSPPDSNIRHFSCSGGGCDTPAANWMTPTPNRQTLNLAGISNPANDYGVLWSYSRAVSAVGTAPNATAGTQFSTANWATLYPGINAPTANFPATGSPYLSPAQTTAPPATRPGRQGRRELKLIIVDCPNVVGTGSCSRLPVLGVGRFFMQVPASGFSGGPNAQLNVEFAGLVELKDLSKQGTVSLYR